MKTSEQKTAEAIIGASLAAAFATIFATAAVVLTFPLGMLQAYTLTKLWAWFAVPNGAPPISWASWLGLAMVVGVLTPPKPLSKDKSETPFRDMLLLIGGRAASYLLALALGWFVLAVWGAK